MSLQQMVLYYVLVQFTLLDKKIRVFSTYHGCLLFEPPKKIGQNFYMCDKRFHLDPILEMYKEGTTFGIVFITGKMYLFYKIIKTGEHYDSKKIYSSTVRLPKKQKKGGQSAQRFCRIRNNEEAAYIKKVSERVIEYFVDLETGKATVKKIIFAGPSSKKEKLKNEPLIQQYFSFNTVIFNTSDLNDTVIFETLNNVKNLFESNNIANEEKVLDFVKNLLATTDEKTVYGVKEINEAFGSLKLIITDKETLPLLKIDTKCEVKLVSKERLNRIIGTIGLKWY